MKNTALLLACWAAASSLVLLGASAAPATRTAPVCFVSNQVVTVENIPTGTLCIKRSDDGKHLANPTTSSLTFGAPTTKTAVSLTFWSTEDCSSGEIGHALACTFLPDTVCTINPNTLKVTVSNVASNVKCVKEGPSGHAAPVDGVATLPTLAASCSDEIEISLFTSAGCTKGTQLQAIPDIYCHCSSVTPTTPTATPSHCQCPAGPQGPHGPQGPQGCNGSQGIQGPQGPQGPQGFNGSAGPAGEQGPPGPPGANGTNGADGTSATSNTLIPYSSGCSFVLCDVFYSLGFPDFTAVPNPSTSIPVDGFVVPYNATVTALVANMGFQYLKPYIVKRSVDTEGEYTALLGSDGDNDDGDNSVDVGKRTPQGTLPPVYVCDPTNITIEVYTLAPGGSVPTRQSNLEVTLLLYKGQVLHSGSLTPFLPLPAHWPPVFLEAGTTVFTVLISNTTLANFGFTFYAGALINWGF